MSSATRSCPNLHRLLAKAAPALHVFGNRKWTYRLIAVLWLRRRQPASVAPGSPGNRRTWQWWVSRSSRAAARGKSLETSIQPEKSRLEVMQRLWRSFTSTQNWNARIRESQTPDRGLGRLVAWPGMPQRSELYCGATECVRPSSDAPALWRTRGQQPPAGSPRPAAAGY